MREASSHQLQLSAREAAWASKLIVVAFANKGNLGLCRLLLSALRFDVPLTVLGWEPKASDRWKVWYCSSKFVMASEWVRRQPQLSPDATVIILDGLDVMFQDGPAAILAASQRLLSTEHRSVAAFFSAEAYCVPCSKADEEALKQRARDKLSSRPGRASELRFLNAGTMVVRASELGHLMSAYVAQADRSEATRRAHDPLSGARCAYSANQTISELHAMRTLYMRQTPCVYHPNDQARAPPIYILCIVSDTCPLVHLRAF